MLVLGLAAHGAVVEVTAGGNVNYEPTYQFSDSSGNALATLTGSSANLTASTDLVTGSGNSVDAAATLIAALQAKVTALEAQVQSLLPPPPPPPNYASDGVVATLAGSGSQGSTDATGASASFYYPLGVAISPDGSTALVADGGNHKIRSVVIATGAVTTLAGSGSAGSTDATGASASFNGPRGVAITPDGFTALVADYYNHKIRSIVIATGVVTTLAGSGSSGSTDAMGTAASFNRPYDVAITPDGSTALVVDRYNNKIRSIVIATGAVTTLAGSGSSGSTDATGASASFNQPHGVAITPDGSTALVAEYAGHKIRSIVIATGAVTTLAGSGSAGSTDATGASASFNQPHGVAITPDGFTALVGDRVNHKIRSIVIATGAVTTLAGSGSAGSTDATGASASFKYPFGVAITPDGFTALVSDYGNHKIRSITFGIL